MREEDREQKKRWKKRFLLLPSFLILFTLVLSFSCSPVHHVSKASKTYIIEKVPFYPQTTYQCGPASLAGVMSYWGVHVTPDEISKDIYSESARGTLTIDMILYAEKKGLRAQQYKGSIEDLKKNIESGHPVIVLVDYGFFLYQANHFLVIIGYNEDGIVVNSGKERNMFISEKDFIRIWEKTKFWTLLIKPNE